jgi:hypothetical protein
MTCPAAKIWPVTPTTNSFLAPWPQSPSDAGANGCPGATWTTPNRQHWQTSQRIRPNNPDREENRQKLTGVKFLIERVPVLRPFDLLDCLKATGRQTVIPRFCCAASYVQHSIIIRRHPHGTPRMPETLLRLTGPEQRPGRWLHRLAPAPRQAPNRRTVCRFLTISVLHRRARVQSRCAAPLTHRPDPQITYLFDGMIMHRDSLGSSS